VRLRIVNHQSDGQCETKRGIARINVPLNNRGSYLALPKIAMQPKRMGDQRPNATAWERYKVDPSHLDPVEKQLTLLLTSCKFIDPVNEIQRNAQTSLTETDRLCTAVPEKYIAHNSDIGLIYLSGCGT
jgi:hypothetical protein